MKAPDFSRLIAGGHFGNFCVSGTCAVRHHIAAVNPANGSLDGTWAPNVNSTLGVFALADTTIGLALGGDFTSVGGFAQAHLAFLQTGSSVPVDSTPPAVGTLPDAILRKPGLRGVIALGQAMSIGFKALSISAREASPEECKRRNS